MRASAFDPPSIPAEFWARPSVAQALTKRDMGALFRLLRQYTGLSQTRIATATGIPQGRVSELIRDKRAVGAAHVFERIANGLDMPDVARVALGLAPHQPPVTAGEASPARSRTRRETDLVRQITAARNIDGVVVAALQSETETIRLLDRRLGAPTVAAKLEAHIGQVETGLRYSLRPSNRQQLAAVLADASALAGWQAIDMGRLPQPGITSSAPPPPPAKPETPACWPSPQASRHTSCSTSATRPKRWRWSAPSTTKPTPPSRTRYAAGYAPPKPKWPPPQARKPRAATPSTAPPAEVGYGPSGEDLPYLALNETHLARWRGNCLVHFGDPQTADELATALGALDGSFTRAEAGLRCDLAAALHVRGERQEARRAPGQSQRARTGHRIGPPAAPHPRPDQATRNRSLNTMPGS